MGTTLGTVVVLMATTLGAAPMDEPTPTDSPSTSPSASPSAESPSPTASRPTVADPTEEPDQEPEPTATSEPEPTPELYVVLSVPRPVVQPGDKVKATAHVYATGAVAKAAKLTVTANRGVTATPTCTLSAGACSLGDVSAAGDFIPVELSVPASATPGSLRVTTSVSARAATSKTVVHLLTVAKKSTASPSATPSATSSATPSATSTTPTSTASTPAGTGATTYSAPSGTSPTALPSVSSSTAANGTELPPIVADASSPTSQPLDSSQNVAAIRPGTPDAELDRLVRVQAIWLGALLALFAALLIQLKRPLRGSHRRPSKGTFAR